MKIENLIKRKMANGYIKPSKREYQFLQESEGMWAVRLVHFGNGKKTESRELLNMKELAHEVGIIKNNFLIRYTRCFA